MLFIKQFSSNDKIKTYQLQTNLNSTQAKQNFNDLCLNYAKTVNQTWQQNCFKTFQRELVPNLKNSLTKLKQLKRLGKKWQTVSEVSAKIKITRSISVLATEVEQALYFNHVIPAMNNDWLRAQQKELLSQINCAALEQIFANRTRFFIQDSIVSYIKQGHATAEHIAKLAQYVRLLINVINELANHSKVKLPKQQLKYIYGVNVLKENTEQSNITKIVFSDLSDILFDDFLLENSDWQPTHDIQII